MADEREKAREQGERFTEEPPPGAEIAARWTAHGRQIDYTARAGWIVLRKHERPLAEIFSVSYLADGEAQRPVTFVFNGGPGASSAYLHMGAVGPTRVAFPADGSPPRMPPQLVSNEESWLAFSDLVFVDPVGTGFSRAIAQKDTEGAAGGAQRADAEDDEPRGKEFFGHKRDLESLCEFISRWLTANRRWGSPVLIAGESYGGYRAGRLVRTLQERSGIGLSAAILISPALEFGPLAPGDYDVLGWVDLLPTMALTAVHHGRSRAFAPDSEPQEVLAEAERFATGEYPQLLIRGASMPAAERGRVLERFAELTGLARELVERCEARVPIATFARELLRDRRRVLGLYDATVTAVDPFPDREPFAGPDPTLAGIEAAYTGAINRQLRQAIGVQTDREYVLLSEEVNKAWRDDDSPHLFNPPAGATDDFRYGMSLNVHMRAFIAHGRYDLVTPYYSSDRLRNLMRLDPQVAERVTVRHFDGGHMFYARERSRRQFAAAIAAFVAQACAGG